jgi:hypothetical protein
MAACGGRAATGHAGDWFFSLAGFRDGIRRDMSRAATSSARR